jgi:alpha-D-ribose 1-methylphosphonate 5-triphosphate synthase subunit PhnL
VSQTADVIKMTVNMSKENMDSAKTLATKNSTTVTDIINRAVVLEKFFEEKKAEGAKILVKNKDGSMIEVFFR